MIRQPLKRLRNEENHEEREREREREKPKKPSNTLNKSYIVFFFKLVGWEERRVNGKKKCKQEYP